MSGRVLTRLICREHHRPAAKVVRRDGRSLYQAKVRIMFKENEIMGLDRPSSGKAIRSLRANTGMDRVPEDLLEYEVDLRDVGPDFPVPVYCRDCRWNKTIPADDIRTALRDGKPKLLF